MAITVSAPANGTLNTPLGVVGTCASGATVAIGLSTQNVTAPGGLASATVAGTQFAGTLTPASAGTWYAWAVDTATGDSAVSGAITVASTASLGSVGSASAIAPSLPVNVVPVPNSELETILAGGGSGGGSVTGAAAVTISAHLAVAASTAGVVPGDSQNTALAGAVIGISATAANAGGSVTVQTSGPLVFSGWSWTAGQPVYAGANGVLTQTPPATGFLQVVGIAQASDTVIVGVEAPFIL